MAINLDPVGGYLAVREHFGHDIVVAGYGRAKYPDFRPRSVRAPKGAHWANVAIECETCSEVLLDFDFPGWEALDGRDDD